MTPRSVFTCRADFVRVAGMFGLMSSSIARSSAAWRVALMIATERGERRLPFPLLLPQQGMHVLDGTSGSCSSVASAAMPDLALSA